MLIEFVVRFSQLSFYTGCGEDDQCLSDLHLNAYIAKYQYVNFIYLELLV